MFAHDFAGAFAIIEKARIGDFAFEFGKAFAFTLNEKIKVHDDVAAAVSAAEQGGRRGERLYKNLTLLRGASGLGAAVTAREFFHATGSIDELLFASEKRVASGADADFNVTPSRASVIHRAARAHDIGLWILRMNVRFHVRKGARNLRRMVDFRKR